MSRCEHGVLPKWECMECNPTGFEQYSDSEIHDAAIRVEERAKIIAWARKVGAIYQTSKPMRGHGSAQLITSHDFADAIERGEHLK